jgi:hypothetical protein
VILRMGRSSARNKAMQERRQVREQGADAPAGRLSGVCSLCGRYHAAPEMRTECPRCGKAMCWSWCECEEGET